MVFLSDTGGGVEHLDVELLGAVDDLDSLSGRDVVRNFRRKHAVVHQNHVQVGQVLDAELLEAVGQHVSRLCIRAVADFGHGDLALESAAHSVVDALGLSPRFLQGQRTLERLAYIDFLVAVALVALELLDALLDDGDVRHGLDHFCVVVDGK